MDYIRLIEQIKEEAAENNMAIYYFSFLEREGVSRSSQVRQVFKQFLKAEKDSADESERLL